MDDMNRESGKIIFFNEEKGYGFIKPDSSNRKENIFLHKTNIKTVGVTTLAEGTEVEFSTETTDKGLSASEVIVA